MLNAIEVDEYISGSIRCGKNYMGLPIFLALGITPYLMYFYSYGKVFNGEVFEALSIFIIVISVISVLVALYLIVKTKDFNAKFKSNNNNDFILNQFAENKLKFMYEKFKTKRIGKIILSSVIYLIAIVSNIYLCFMFNGSINMLYILLSITVFLYGLATYIVLNIKYEQKAYKVLLTNVD